MKFIYVSILLFFIGMCINCTPKTQLPVYVPQEPVSNKFAEFLEEGSTAVRSGYNYMVEKTKEGKFIYKEFYPETRQITQFYTYEDVARSKKEGLGKEWWDDGKLRFEGFYENGKRFGTWKFHYNSNDKYSMESGSYNDGLRQGRWTLVNDKEILLRETNYKNGKKEGAFKKYNEEGKLVKQAVYVNDEAMEVETFGAEEAENTSPEDVDRMPSWKGCELKEAKKMRQRCSDERMLRHVYGEIKYPAQARENGIEGKALVNFVVEKSGKVSEIKVMRGISQDIKAEVLRVVSGMPNWNPGMKNGEPVKVRYTLPVSFKLR